MNRVTHQRCCRVACGLRCKDVRACRKMSFVSRRGPLPLSRHASGDWTLEQPCRFDDLRRRNGSRPQGRRRCSRRPPPELAQDRLENGQHHADALCADDQVPQRFELLPARCVRHVAKAGANAVVRASAAENRSPSIEVAIRAMIPGFERISRHARRTEDRMTRVVKIPTPSRQSLLRHHALIQRRAWIRRQDVERRTLEPIALDPAFYRDLQQRRQSGTLGAMETTLDPILSMLTLADRLAAAKAPEATRLLAQVQVARDRNERIRLVQRALEVQGEIEQGLAQLLERLEEWNDYQDVIQVTRALRDRQRDLQTRTEEARVK